MGIIIFILLIIVGVYLYYYYNNRTNKQKKMNPNNCSINCVQSHSQHGHNYSWLTPLGHGKVLQVYFEEPVGSGNWKLYNDDWWATHCRAVDHHSTNLVQAHMDAFVNPGRFARMLFIFEDGTRTEPNQHFWELEADYFRNYNC